MFMNDENKRHGQDIKIARETINNQKKKYNSVKHLGRWSVYGHVITKFSGMGRFT